MGLSLLREQWGDLSSDQVTPGTAFTLRLAAQVLERAAQMSEREAAQQPPQQTLADLIFEAGLEVGGEIDLEGFECVGCDRLEECVSAVDALGIMGDDAIAASERTCQVMMAVRHVGKYMVWSQSALEEGALR